MTYRVRTIKHPLSLSFSFSLSINPERAKTEEWNANQKGVSQPNGLYKCIIRAGEVPPSSLSSSLARTHDKFTARRRRQPAESSCNLVGKREGRR